MAVQAAPLLLSLRSRKYYSVGASSESGTRKRRIGILRFRGARVREYIRREHPELKLITNEGVEFVLFSEGYGVH
jgi:hypothetical protein